MLSQSAPTILVLKKLGQFATLKKIGSKIWGAKNRVLTFFVIQKEKRQPGLFTFKLQIASRKNMVQTKVVLGCVSADSCVVIV